jgi:hypothetical protein
MMKEMAKPRREDKRLQARLAQAETVIEAQERPTRSAGRVEGAERSVP